MSRLKVVVKGFDETLTDGSHRPRNPDIVQAVRAAFEKTRPDMEQILEEARQVTKKREEWLNSISDKALRESVTD